MSKYQDRTDGFEAGQNATARPPCCDDEHLEFLDDLRSSGKTNMMGARPYLMQEYDLLTDEQAATILGYWMKTFGKPDR